MTYITKQTVGTALISTVRLLQMACVAKLAMIWSTPAAATAVPSITNLF